MIRKARLLLLPLVLWTFTGVSSASALVMMAGTPNLALSSFPGPYSSFTVTLDSSKTKAQILISGTTEGPYSYLLGGTNALQLNVNGPFSVVNAFSVVNSVAGKTSTQPISAFDINMGQSINAAGFGNFNFAVKNFNTFGHEAFTMGFIIQKTDGLWNSENAVLAANTAGFVAALHVYVYSASCGNSPCQTSFAGLAPIANPEPASWLLTGIGLVFVVFQVRRRRAG